MLRRGFFVPPLHPNKSDGDQSAVLGRLQSSPATPQRPENHEYDAMRRGESGLLGLLADDKHWRASNRDHFAQIA
jgi:hypothetical protein